MTTSTRLELLPDIPTVGEYLPGYEASGWLGIGAPRNTPTDIIDRLNKEINAGLADPKFKARLADLGLTPLPGSPADFGKFIADETEKWGKSAPFALCEQLQAVVAARVLNAPTGVHGQACPWRIRNSSHTRIHGDTTRTCASGGYGLSSRSGAAR
jgi:hypothetical protein